MSKKKKRKVVGLRAREASLKRKIRRHLKTLGFTKTDKGELQLCGSDKELVRAAHRAQRAEKISESRGFIENKSPKLLKYFASGLEVNPERVSPVLDRVIAGSWQSDLFRLASLTWSVPVSNGFGRRLRYLVWDENNEKLIGLIAIGDPVFNLSTRDNLIGWTVADRTERLVNVMDAYVLGAVPPYNMLLGGKLVASLVKSRDIYDDFARTYGATEGIISGKRKKARLLAVTTSSSMGRSSVYNRLKLNNEFYFKSIGYTGGWGHFHIPDRLFTELRDYLDKGKELRSNRHAFGNGPNWRLRTTRAALEELGFKDDLLRHGIKREVFISTLASNALRILKTGKGRPDLSLLLNVDEISAMALERWVQPRAIRRPEYQEWGIEDLRRLLRKQGPERNGVVATGRARG